MYPACFCDNRHLSMLVAYLHFDAKYLTPLPLL